MKKIIYFMTALVLGGTMLTSCNDYLDTVQSKGNDEVLTSGKQVEALFANSEMFNTKSIGNVYASDDYGLTTDIFDALGYVDENICNAMTWNITDLVNNPYGDEAWSAEYQKIFNANLVLNNLEELTDASEEAKNEYAAQAHMLRAMAMWSLVNTYCLPYSAQNASSLGLSLKQTTSYEEDMTRATLQQTYDFILADLDEAAKTANTTIAGNKRWWVSRPAVAAMKARVYLFMQDYDKAATYAREALQCSDAQLDDYNQLGYRVAQVSLDGEMQDVSYSELYRYGDNQVANYKENYLSEYYSIAYYALIPSEELVSLYDQDNDLRYRQFFNKYALWEQGIGGFGDDLLYHKFKDRIQSGPTVPEMLLTEAEALARGGKWQEAMPLVNQLRQARIDKDADCINLSAANQEEAVKAILDERHREMPFVMRWWDVRRLSCNETGYDDVTLERTFYRVSDDAVDDSELDHYVLPVGSKRYAQPIIHLEVTRSNGQIEQNAYDEGSVQITQLEMPDDGEGGYDGDEEGGYDGNEEEWDD